jgi:hypothetical protein
MAVKKVEECNWMTEQNILEVIYALGCWEAMRWLTNWQKLDLAIYIMT